jgi:hypothetical protein
MPCTLFIHLNILCYLLITLYPYYFKFFNSREEIKINIEIKYETHTAQQKIFILYINS